MRKTEVSGSMACLGSQSQAGDGQGDPDLLPPHPSPFQPPPFPGNMFSFRRITLTGTKSYKEILIHPEASSLFQSQRGREWAEKMGST